MEPWKPLPPREEAASRLYGHQQMRLRQQLLDGDPALDVLSRVWGLRRAIDDATDQLVHAAREEGASWARIAEALGMSKQAAHERWHLALAPAEA